MKINSRITIYFLFITFIVYSGFKNGGNSSDLFNEDFETGLSKWKITNKTKIQVVESGDDQRGKVLALYPAEASVYAIIDNSNKWNRYSVEGYVKFPENHHHYMGLIYNYQESSHRADFGSVHLFGPYGGEKEEHLEVRNKYLKTRIPDYEPGNRVRANPHFDGNATQKLYPEFWANVPADDIVKVGEWRKFKAEVYDSVCHFYVGNMERPQLTFEHFFQSTGSLGFKPRDTGSPCWIDDISVKRISQLSYQGDPIPNTQYPDKDRMISSWKMWGPFIHKQEGIVLDDSLSQNIEWKTVNADARGCVNLSKMTERVSGKKIVYALKTVQSEKATKATLNISNTNPIHVWVNKKYIGKLKVSEMAWHDFLSNEENSGQSIEFDLQAGENEILLKIAGGRFGGDGFYSSLSID
ncbi:MAG: hypothetical protein R8G66_22010 [Cytophagales bacterium]|nr:hypothetical protein [Cytophagales bacterium]